MVHFTLAAPQTWDSFAIPVILALVLVVIVIVVLLLLRKDGLFTNLDQFSQETLTRSLLTKPENTVNYEIRM